MKANHFFASLLFFIVSTVLTAQEAPVNRAQFRLKMEKIATPIQVDGVLDEAAWATAETTGPFYRILPTDEGFARSPSVVRMAYDEEHVYVAIVCFDSIPGKRPVESLRRDFSFGLNDNFICFIDTYNDQTNGFAFGVSAAGAQWEGIQANGGFVSLDWDTKWRSAVVNLEDRWVVELAIPFRSIRYKEGATEWGINFSRLDLKTNEKTSWAPVPRQFQSANLAFTGTVHWEEPLPKRGVQYSIIPYLSWQVTKEHQPEAPANSAPRAGLDAKVMLSTSLNLDLTLNPDYSNVEVDQQRTNLDRFELFFPERRQFFLENSDLFASLGDEANRPFFSRRIGLQAPVLAGARLSGKINENLRIGVMDMQTQLEDSLPAGNFGVIALQQKVLARSNVSFFMVNKQVHREQGEQFRAEHLHNRVAGIEFNLASADNRWTGKAYYHQSIYAGATTQAASMAANLNYSTRNWLIIFNNSHIDQAYLAEVGYVRRPGSLRSNPQVGYRFYPKDSKIAFHGPTVKADYFFNASGVMTDRYLGAGYGIDWLNRSQLRIEWNRSFVQLREPFDPTRSDGVQLATGSNHHWSDVGLSFQSDARKLFNYYLGTNRGGFFNGDRWAFRSELNYRIQPYGRLGIISTYDILTFPAPYNSARYLLIGPKLDVTFTNTMFLTTYLQYNDQIDNVNLNTRFQWRYAPGSDLFVVYTHNAYPEEFQIKNNGLAIKLAYWFN